MKCPNCGYESKEPICESCGTEIQTDSAIAKCSKCGSSNIKFKREKIGTMSQTAAKGKSKKGKNNGKSQYASKTTYRTVGVCQDCGHTWSTSEPKSGAPLWLWVVGWLVIFPIPLTVLLLRKKNMNPKVKYGIIGVAWIIYLIMIFSNGSDSSSDSNKTDKEPTKNKVVENVDETTTPVTSASIEEKIIETNIPEDPEDVEPIKSTNPLMNCTVKRVDLKSGDGSNVVGSRSYIEFSEDEFYKLSKEQIAEFGLNVISKENTNYFTIDFKNGRGVVFSMCDIDLGNIGSIDETGGITNSDNYVSISSDGSVEFETDILQTEADTSTDNNNQVSSEESVPTEYKNALKKAESYSSSMHMSKNGIYNQLTSEYGEKFAPDAAQYAIDNLVADYNKNALETAKTYSDRQHMSKKGIYNQLTSDNGEGFTADEAQYAVDNLVADYNKNALETAKSYSKNMAMSKDAIYEQLISEYGEGFTEAEAQYAVDNLE